MLTLNQLEDIDRRLQKGMTPEQIASEMGYSPSTFRNEVLTSGKKIVIYRRLVDTAPAINADLSDNDLAILEKMNRPINFREDKAA